MKNSDLAIIGSGPGGYVAALYAARHGLRVSVIEQGFTGGTCLNRGCIPTKSLLHSAAIISAIRSAPAAGIDIDGFRLDIQRMVARKNEVVVRLRAGVESLLKAAKIDVVRGRGRLAADGSVVVDGAEAVLAKHVIIAAGSSAASLNGIDFDADRVHSSDSILDISSIPQSLVIIGGGVIGCEFAHLFNILGSKITIIELTDRLIPTQSREASRRLEQSFKKRGIESRTSSRVETLCRGDLLTVRLADGSEVLAEKALVSVGREPNSADLGLDEAGIKTGKGRILVDEDLRTTRPGVFAVGDCVIGPQLAHKASYDGIVAVDAILGRQRKADYSNIPNCIWTEPQIASVGMSEDDAKGRLADVKVATFPYLASGKARLSGKTEGFVKIIGDHAGTILGVEIVGDDACELIAEAVLAKTAKIPVKDWAQAVHGHPTLSEMLQEAAQSFCGAGIHAL